MEIIRQHIVQNWGLTVAPIIGMIDYRHVAIKLNNQEDFTKAWTRNSHVMEGAMFRLFKWHCEFSLQHESSIAPIWIRLPLLPLNFCILSYLKAITQSLGNFLRVDKPTLTHARPAFTRVCVETDLLKPKESHVWIGQSMEEGFWQPIVYEGSPKYCKHCLLQGHEIRECIKTNIRVQTKVDLDTQIQVNMEKIQANNFSFEARASILNRKDIEMKYIPKVAIENKWQLVKPDNGGKVFIQKGSELVNGKAKVDKVHDYISQGCGDVSLSNGFDSFRMEDDVPIDSQKEIATEIENSVSPLKASTKDEGDEPTLLFKDLNSGKSIENTSTSSILSPNAKPFELLKDTIQILDKENIPLLEGVSNGSSKSKKKKKKKKKKGNDSTSEIPSSFQGYVPSNNTLEDLVRNYNLDSSYHLDPEDFSNDEYEGLHSDYGVDDTDHWRKKKHSMTTRGHRVQTRWYVRSRNDEQLISHDARNHTKGCSPETTIVKNDKEVPIVPCGLIAWSLFNDTYTFSHGADTLFINKTNIAWKSDKKKFGKDVYPKHFQAGDLQGGAKLNDTIPLNQQEDLMVWMRTAAFPTFRKLYGRIEQDLERNDTITVVIKNNYNTYSFGGTKKLVLSTTTFIGGKNDFLGISFIVVGVIYLLLAVAIIVTQQLYNPLRDMEAQR